MTAAATLSQTIASVQASQLREVQLKNEKDIAGRLVVPAAEPLTKPEQELLAVWATWCSQRGVRHLPANPSVIATFVGELGHRGDDFILSVLAAIRRMHVNLNTADPTASRPVWFVLEKILKTDMAPRSWPPIEKTLWATLPAPTRKIITRREAERENDIRNKQNQLSAAIKAAEAKRNADNAANQKIVDNTQEENDMSKKQGWQKGVGKASPSETGIKHISTPRDNKPGRDISSNFGQEHFGRQWRANETAKLE